MDRSIHSQILACWFLTGATASGKTAIAPLLAEKLDAEILSLDSMAIYRGMDIGTAKPTAAARQRVPHHLLDLVDPTESFSVSQYRDAAHAAIDEVHARGKRILFVGGTPLYLKSLLRGIFEGPPADWEFRNEIEQQIEVHGLEALHERLKLVDPLSAYKLHPHDKRRMIRALEVYRATGQPISHLQTHFEESHPARECRVFALHWDRTQLHARIDDRVESMFRDGLVEEVVSLLDRYGPLSHTASQAVGYREVLDYLDREGDLAETIQSVKQRTRQFARRQETWFRALSECRWIDRHHDNSVEEIVEHILASDRNESESPG